jgi:DNA-binding MarR family transcriptional regulator/N-acetylglutamate synthase-like GNAT family acetyltransferase
MHAAERAQINAIRGFNRFYTRQIGVLRKSYLNSEFPLTEARVLYELAHRENATAGELARDLDLDPGYLSRILQSFEKRGLLSRTPALYDRRQSHLELTDRGRKAFAPLDSRSGEESAAMLGGLSAEDRTRLIAAMNTIESLLGDRALTAASPAIAIRLHQPGDMGWVVHRHGVLYARERSWGGAPFEALVAEIVAKFLREFDPRRDRCWIAEKDGRSVGSVFLVKTEEEEVGQLRLLLVEPGVRGLGIGERLVAECLAFARQAGYRRVMLWTQAELHAAQHIYEKAGFRLVREEEHRHFGVPVVGRVWEVAL